MRLSIVGRNIMNLLVVDDEFYAIEGIRCALDWKNFGIKQIYSATTVEEAKHFILNENIDIMLCDIEMIGETGFDLLKWLNENNCTTITIFVTCYEIFDYAKEAIRLGALEYLLKPVSEEELADVIVKASTIIQQRNKQKEQENLLQVVQKYFTLRAENKSVNSDILKKVNQFILENIDKNITRTEIADQVYLNPDYLNRIIKKETNLSLGEYVTKEKLKVAEFLIVTTAAPISDIAARVGYNDMSYFFKCFKRETGLTPKEYRLKEQKKEKD
jgi:YesN/AraC family two-component response regulator